MPQTSIEWIAQICSILGMVCIIGSMQFKKMFYYYAAQFIGSSLFLLSFILLGSASGAIMNIISIPRAIINMMGKKGHKTWILACLIALLVGCGYFSFLAEGWIALLPFFGQLFGTIGMWTHNGKTMRIMQLAGASPAWLTYDVIAKSSGGIGCELFTIVSVIISIIRFGWKELDRKQL